MVATGPHKQTGGAVSTSETSHSQGRRAHHHETAVPRRSAARVARQTLEGRTVDPSCALNPAASAERSPRVDTSSTTRIIVETCSVPTITIVIPVYNRHAELRRALSSVQEQ